MSGQSIYNYARANKKIVKIIEDDLYQDGVNIDFKDMFPFQIQSGTRVIFILRKNTFQIFTVYKVEVPKFNQDMKLKIFTDKGVVECAPGRVVRVRS